MKELACAKTIFSTPYSLFIYLFSFSHGKEKQERKETSLTLIISQGMLLFLEYMSGANEP